MSTEKTAEDIFPPKKAKSRSFQAHAIVMHPMYTGRIEVFGAYTERQRAVDQIKTYQATATEPRNFQIMPIMIHEGPEPEEQSK
jgi:hypothetical protein